MNFDTSFRIRIIPFLRSLIRPFSIIFKLTAWTLLHFAFIKTSHTHAHHQSNKWFIKCGEGEKLRKTIVDGKFSLKKWILIETFRHHTIIIINALKMLFFFSFSLLKTIILLEKLRSLVCARVLCLVICVYVRAEWTLCVNG